MTAEGDDVERVDVSRRRHAFELGAAIASSLIAGVVGWQLADRFGQCEIGVDSYGWIPLIVGTCLLAPGIVTAIVRRSVIRRKLMRTLVSVTCVCAIPLFAAWMSWLDRWSGCPI